MISTRRGRQQVRSRARAILMGSAPGIASALASDIWTAHHIEVCAAAVIGGGEVAVPVTTRAPAWDAIDFLHDDDMPLVVLTEPPPSAEIARVLLARAADAGKRVAMHEDGRLRAMVIGDLVGRLLADTDWERIRGLIVGRRVLITGGAGSIGGELARRVATLGPARLTLLDSSEFNLFQISHELPSATLAMADIRDGAAVRRWFERERPDIVFHAAALKQVPLVEAFPSEGVLTNIVGLRHVTEAALAIDADVIFVSTDKAVDPSGVMGASKRLGEIYAQALDRRGGARVLPVRLGNVLGSAGSVIPLFERQLAAGGPLTVTDPEVTRYFLSIPQAANALLQAAAVGLGAESTRGAAMVIDMGEALPVVEIARDIICLEGLRPNVDIDITFVGLRPGEKLHEQLIASDESCAADPAPGVSAAISTAIGLAEMNEIVDRLTLLARAGDDDAIVAELFKVVGVVATPAPIAAAG